MPHSWVNGRQIKAARALVGWRRKDLAERAGMSAATVKVVESEADDGESLADTRERLRHTLSAAGIEFLNGGAPGVRLVPKDEGIRPEDLNASNDG